jgi:hypothetical protein
MMSLVDFDKIISFIIARFDKIPFKHFKENIFQILSQHSYQKNIVKRAINLLSNDVKSMTRSLYNYRSRGVIAQELCMNCNLSMKSDKREKIIVFICGHGFHKRCIRDNQCYICSIQDNKKGRNIITDVKSNKY